jgi:hypothetical protein
MSACRRKDGRRRDLKLKDYIAKRRVRKPRYGEKEIGGAAY